MSDSSDVLSHIIELKESVGRIEQKVDTAVRAIEGNGQPGLRQRVESLESDRSKMWGVGAAVTFVGGAFEFMAHRFLKW